MRKNTPKYIIVHHTGGTDADPLADTSSQTFEAVDAWHRVDPYVWLGYPSSLGYAIGYHYFIDKNGKVSQGRLDTDKGTHTKGHNTKSIDICLAGNFDVTNPTWEQQAALRDLIQRKSTEYGISSERIVPHRRFASKTCYGRRLGDYWAANLLMDEPKPTIAMPPPAPCQAEKDIITQQSKMIESLKQSVAWYDQLISSLIKLLTK